MNDSVYDCSLAGCALASGRRLRDAGMEFISCPRCGVLRIPEENLVHLSVDPDPLGSRSRLLRILFGMRMLWLSREVPALKRKDLRILDLGCGDGQFLQYLVEHGYTRAVGIEPDARRAANARLRQVPVFTSLAEARAAGALGGEVDLILVWHVLEHVARPADFIAEYAALLAPGGRMLVSVPNQASVQTRMFGRYSAWPDYGRHVWYHDASYGPWLARMTPGVSVSLLRDRNFEYEISSWVESIVSFAARRPTIVNQTLKKGEGGTARRMAVAAASLAVLPLATLLAPLSIASGRASTLTFAVERTAGGSQRAP